MKSLKNELIHYVLVFAVIAGTWTPLMDYFQDKIPETIVVSFIVFVITDKLAHWIFKLG